MHEGTCLAVILGGGRARGFHPPHCTIEARRAHRGQVPAHRHPDQQLPELGPAAHLRPHPVQLESLKTRTSHDVQVRPASSSAFVSVSPRSRRRMSGDWFQGTADARAAEQAPLRQPRLPRRADPPGPALPDGLREDLRPPPSRGRRDGGGDPGRGRASHGIRHPQDERLGDYPLRGEAGRGAPAAAGVGHSDAGLGPHRLDGDLSVQARGLERPSEPPLVDFGRHVIRGARAARACRPTSTAGTGKTWDDRLLLPREPALCQPVPPFDFYEASRPVYTHPRFLPARRWRAAW